MEIRKVKPDEIEVLSQICCQTYIDHYSHIRSAKGLKEHLNKTYSIEVLSASIADQNTSYFFVKSEKEPVGYFKLKTGSTLPNSRNQGLELEKIYFLKEQTGKGLGAKAIEFIKSFAIEKKQAFIWLDVLKNKPNAISFYEKMGFSKSFEIPFQTDIMDIGMWVMVTKVSKN